MLAGEEDCPHTTNATMIQQQFSSFRMQKSKLAANYQALPTEFLKPFLHNLTEIQREKLAHLSYKSPPREEPETPPELQDRFKFIKTTLEMLNEQREETL